jgi:hypothetical protein
MPSTRGILQAVGGGDIGLACGEHVRVEERLAQPDKRVREVVLSGNVPGTVRA